MVRARVRVIRAIRVRVRVRAIRAIRVNPNPNSPNTNPNLNPYLIVVWNRLGIHSLIVLVLIFYVYFTSSHHLMVSLINTIWTLICTHMRNVAKKGFSANVPKVHFLSATSVDKNNGTNDKFYRKVAILMYTEMFNFRPQS